MKKQKDAELTAIEKCMGILLELEQRDIQERVIRYLHERIAMRPWIVDASQLDPFMERRRIIPEAPQCATTATLPDYPFIAPLERTLTSQDLRQNQQLDLSV